MKFAGIFLSIPKFVGILSGGGGGGVRAAAESREPTSDRQKSEYPPPI